MKWLLTGILSINIFYLLGQTVSFTSFPAKGLGEVNRMAKDHEGFIWIATDQGISYFNGHEIKQITDSQPCYFLQFTADSMLLAGRDSGRYDLFNPYFPEEVFHFEIPSEYPVTGIFTSDHLQIVSTYGGGLYVLNSDSTYVIKQDLSDFIYEMTTIDNRVYAATDRGILVMDTNGKLLQELLDFIDPIITHLKTHPGDFLIGTSYDSYLYEINPHNELSIRAYPLPEKTKINDLVLSENGQVVLTTTSGLFEFDLKLKEFNRIQTLSETPLSGKAVFDNHHNFWALSSTGLLQKGRMNIKRIDLPVRNVQALEKQGSHLLLGTANGLHIVTSSGQLIKSVLNSANITVLKNIQNYILVGTYARGLYLLDENQIPVRHLEQINGLDNNTVLDIERISENKLMVSTLAGIIILQFDFENGVYLHQDNTLSPQFGYSYVLDIYLSPSGNTWYGRDRNGFIFQNRDSIQPITTIGERRLGTIYSIAELAGQESILSSSREGLLLLNNRTQRMQHLQVPSQEKEEYTSLIPLNNNHLLGISDQGVQLINILDSQGVIYPLIPDPSSVDPFLNNYCTAGEVVWFVHNDQLYEYRNSENIETELPYTKIEKIEVNLEAIKPGVRKLKESENNLVFQYSSNILDPLYNLTYTYKLEGWDPDWRVTRDRSVSYPQLAPGKYSFQVKTGYLDQFAFSPLTTYEFRISRHWYKSWWFYTILILGFCTFAYYFIKKRQKDRLLQAELTHKKIETQLINLKNQLNPHFLFNSFNTLTGLIEENPRRSISFVETLTDFYRAILELGDKELISLGEELKMVVLYGNLLNERFGNGFVLDIEHYDPDLLVPPLTIQMLVENAVKHNIVSTKTPLMISISSNPREISVRNNLNPKLSKPKSTKIGLENIKKRYWLIAGKHIKVIQTNESFIVHLPNINS